MKNRDRIERLESQVDHYREALDRKVSEKDALMIELLQVRQELWDVRSERDSLEHFSGLLEIARQFGREFGRELERLAVADR